MGRKSILAVAISTGLAFAAGSLAYGAALSANAAPNAPEAPAANFGSVLSYQGRLTSAGGVPVNAPVLAVFRIYTDTQISSIWTQTQTITPTNGLFTAYLGSPAAIGTSVFTRAAYIGMQIVGDPDEMLPRTPLNSIIGHADNSTLGAAGVIGNNTGGGNGVYGSSLSGGGIGVNGYGNGAGVVGLSTSGVGVQGNTQNAASAGGFFSGPVPDSNALRIGYGTIQVTNASTNTNTMAYIHQAVFGAGGNMCDSNKATIISNTLSIGDPNAMIFATPRGVVGSLLAPPPVKVLYVPSTTAGCPAGNWVIYVETGAFTDGQQVNVMILRRY